jgi:hypothetical protein
MERSLTYQLPWLNAMLPILLLEELVMALANSNVSKFIIGGSATLRSSLGCPDGWMLNYTGLMDEFRIYNAALSDNEVVALYKLEKDNR